MPFKKAKESVVLVEPVISGSEPVEAVISGSEQAVISGSEQAVISGSAVIEGFNFLWVLQNDEGRDDEDDGEGKDEDEEDDRDSDSGDPEELVELNIVDGIVQPLLDVVMVDECEEIAKLMDSPKGKQQMFDNL